MNILIQFLIAIILLCNFNIALAHPNDRQLFQHIFKDWTTAFNNKDLTKSCQLFATNIVADYRGTPNKNYHTLCDGFKKVFSTAKKRYHYEFKLHEVYRSGDLAAVRITWYLKVYEDNQLISSSQDEGIDIFRENNNGIWQIVNYLGYAI